MSYTPVFQLKLINNTVGERAANAWGCQWQNTDDPNISALVGDTTQRRTPDVVSETSRKAASVTRVHQRRRGTCTSPGASLCIQQPWCFCTTQQQTRTTQHAAVVKTTRFAHLESSYSREYTETIPTQKSQPRASQRHAAHELRTSSIAKYGPATHVPQHTIIHPENKPTCFHVFRR